MRVSSIGGNLEWTAFRQAHLVRVGYNKKSCARSTLRCSVSPSTTALPPHQTLRFRKLLIKCLCHTQTCKCKKKMKKNQIMYGIHIIKVILARTCTGGHYNDGVQHPVPETGQFSAAAQSPGFRNRKPEYVHYLMSIINIKNKYSNSSIFSAVRLFLLQY